MANIVSDATTEEVTTIATQLSGITSSEPDEQNEKHNQILQLPQNIQIAPGRIRIIISENGLAEMLGVGCERISEEHLEIDAAFRHRKRGVETKLILADTASPRDKTLFKTLQKHITTLT